MKNNMPITLDATKKSTIRQIVDWNRLACRADEATRWILLVIAATSVEDVTTIWDNVKRRKVFIDPDEFGRSR